jgi:glyoxylase-like metal-dependent hydrolase (beta-lactamase superfamily II)
MHLGRERVICCWQLGDVLVDPGSGSCLPTLLEALGDERPRALLLAHVHLAHDGASGSLVQRWPDLEVYVHERGSRSISRASTTFCWLPPERAAAGVEGPPPRTSNSGSRRAARVSSRRGKSQPRRESGSWR